MQLHAILTVFVEGDGVVVGDDVIGMALEKVHLQLQLARVGPVIVGFAVGDVTAARFGKQVGNAGQALAVLIDLLIEGPNDCRMPLGVLRDDARCAICGGVVVDQDFVAEAGLL